MSALRKPLDHAITIAITLAAASLAIVALAFLGLLLVNIASALASSIVDTPAVTVALLLVLAAAATVIGLAARTKPTQAPLHASAAPVDKPLPWRGSGVV